MDREYSHHHLSFLLLMTPTRRSTACSARNSDAYDVHLVEMNVIPVYIK